MSDPPHVHIEKLVPGGDGLGHIADGAVFVPRTAPGDLVTLKNLHRRRGVYFADCDQVIRSSPDRTAPPCPWFGHCGGCQWMHLQYSAQLRCKEDIFRQTMTRIARLGEHPSRRVHPSASPYGYRFRAKLQIKGSEAGFYRHSSNDIVSWDRCMQLPGPLNLAVGAMRAVLRKKEDFKSLLSCEAALSPVTGEVTLNWQMDREKASRDGVKRLLDLAEEAAAARKVKLAGQSVHDRRGRILVSRGSELLLEVRGVRLKATPGTFFQVNPEVNEVLVARVLDYLKSAGAYSLLDLYCGNGNFSLPAAQAGLKTLGVESSVKAVQDARAAGGGSSRFVEADVGRFLSRDDDAHDAAIVDPPRNGLPAEVAALLSAKRFRTILYVSCEPSTLARDLARLTGYGYAVTEMELFDMFPQTPHLEALVVMKG